MDLYQLSETRNPFFGTIMAKLLWPFFFGINKVLPVAVHWFNLLEKHKGGLGFPYFGV